MAQADSAPASSSRWRRIWPAALSAALIFAAFPPLKLSFLVFLGLVPWLVYLSDGDSRHGFRSGYVFGLVFWMGELSFIAQFVGEWTQNPLLGWIPYLLACAIGALYFALFGWLASVCYRRSMPWAVPIVWAGIEVFRSYLVGLAFPFGLLAMPLTGYPAIIQSAHYGTIFLTSAWVVLCNVAIGDLVRHRSLKRVGWQIAAFLVLLAVSLGRYYSEPSGESHLVAAGQPGVNMAFGDQRTTESQIAEAVDQISTEASGADLLVLPEGIVKAGTVMPPPIQFRVDSSLPVVFGGQRGYEPSYQSAFSYDGQWHFADKTRLVIFGEYVPFREYLPFLETFNLPGGSLKPADHITSLRVGRFTVGGALCFEALFPDVTYRHALNGSNLIAVMSVDDWYLGSIAPEQLRDASNWRAIEVGAPVVRAASMGFTIIVDARGRTVASAPLTGRHSLIASVRVPPRPDLFPLLPLFSYLALLSLPGLLIFDALARRKVRRVENEAAECMDLPQR
jgi:apolipoprotein N-acyltransferase